MFFSPELIEAVELVLRSHNIHDPVFPDAPVTGGINECVRLRAGNHSIFAKVNSSIKYPHMFALEAQGLKLIAGTNTIAVPQVLGHGVAADQQFLLLDWVDAGRESAGSHRILGERLARMHRVVTPMFGLEYNNYIGSLTQINTPKHNWAEFFVENRIAPMLERAVQAHLIGQEYFGEFEKIFQKLDQLFPPHSPALIHGDLWSGNYMINKDREPLLIDPAPYYGHREMDIAMSRLFGGFHQAFYEAYQEEYPLDTGWEDRLDLWNLYPLLVHLNLFGIGYLPQVIAVLKKYR